MNPATASTVLPAQSADGYNYDTAARGISDVRVSADRIVPLLLERFHPQSVVDFGCGLGDWLLAFGAAGVTDGLGLDGEWVPAEHLQIPPGQFRRVELSQRVTLERRFDLAVCLEVAEHLPDAVADQLLDSLAQAADVVVFSAAIPGQGGFKHVNERFQGDWVERFAARGYIAFDLIRPRVWTDDRVLLWYRQNLLVYANARAVTRHGLVPQPFIASLVHPEIYRAKLDPKNWSLRQIARHLGWYARRSIGNRLGRT